MDFDDFSMNEFRISILNFFVELEFEPWQKKNRPNQEFSIAIQIS